jgi:hypothetical protein
MNRNRIARACMIATASLALAACSPEPAAQADAPAAASATVASPVSIAVAQDEGEKCTDEPRTDENDKRPRCGGVATASATHAFHVVGGSGDPVDQVVCDITDSFVLDGKMFGVEFSGGADGTYKFVRTPDIPGLSWKAGGRYHIEFPDGEDMPGTMTTEGGGTTTAGAISRDTAGAEHFTLTPVEACE